jgi:hypothetical protein
MLLEATLQTSIGRCRRAEEENEYHKVDDVELAAFEAVVVGAEIDLRVEETQFLGKFSHPSIEIVL